MIIILEIPLWMAYLTCGLVSVSLSLDIYKFRLERKLRKLKGYKQ